MSDDQIIDHDSWNYSPAKLPKQSKIALGPIYGVLPFTGVRQSRLSQLELASCVDDLSDRRQ